MWTELVFLRHALGFVTYLTMDCAASDLTKTPPSFVKNEKNKKLRISFGINMMLNSPHKHDRKLKYLKILM